MWGGLHFFISIDTLVTLDKAIPAASLKDKPGNPQQRILRDAEEQYFAVTSFPNVTLLLSTLKATGNQIHLFSAWSVDQLREVVAAFGWERFAADVRTLHHSPGDESLFTLTSVDCEPAWYANSVVLVSELSQWSPLLDPLLMHVDHSRTRASLLECGVGIDSSPSGTEPVSAIATVAGNSMELLFALCRCVTLAEWRVRVAGTPASVCSALSAANTFSCCRFYVPQRIFTTRLASLLATHGAVVVEDERAATHVLFASPKEEMIALSSVGGYVHQDGQVPLALNEEHPDSSNSSVADASSFSSSDEEGSTSSSSSSSSSSEQADASPGSPAPAPQALAEDRETVDDAPATVEVAAKPAKQPLTMPSSANRSAQFVTRNWVENCCRALRLLPVPSPIDVLLPQSETSTIEQLRTTGTLLTAILPPLDAKPLPLSQLEQICDAYHFPTDALTGATMAETFGRLTSLFKGVATVRQMSTNKKGVAGEDVQKNPGTVEAPAVSPPQIVLCRTERKRDRDAVSEHQKLQAAQFAMSLEAAMKEQRASTARNAGTQTSGPRFVHAGVNTDAAASADANDVPAFAASIAEAGAATAPVARVQVAAVSASEEAYLGEEVPQPPLDKASAGVDEEEWMAHLRNAEGKLLKSTLSRDEMGKEDGVSVAEMASGKAEGDEEAAVQNVDGGGKVGVDMQSSKKDTVVTAPVELPPASSIFSAPPTTSTTIALPRKQVVSSSPPPTTSNSNSQMSSTRVNQSESILPTPALTPSAVGNSVQRSTSTFAPFAPPSSSAKPRAQCAIDISALSPSHQANFFQYLQLMPMFSPFSSRATAVADFAHNCVRCVFVSEKEAQDFLQIRYIDFGGKEHPIVPITAVGEGPEAPASPRRLIGKSGATSLSSMRSFEVEKLLSQAPSALSPKTLSEVSELAGSINEGRELIPAKGRYGRSRRLRRSSWEMEVAASAAAATDSGADRARAGGQSGRASRISDAVKPRTHSSSVATYRSTTWRQRRSPTQQSRTSRSRKRSLSPDRSEERREHRPRGERTDEARRRHTQEELGPRSHKRGDEKRRGGRRRS